MNILHKAAEQIADFVLPRTCVSCGAPAHGSYLCPNCRATVLVRSQTGICRVCGKTAAMMEPVNFLCEMCRKTKPKYDMARSAAYFSGVIRDLIHGLKYHGAVWLTRDLSDIMSGCFFANWNTNDVDVICPVPLHPVKLRKRGYNQAELLAERMSKNVSLPVDTKILARIRNTSTQTLKTAEARHENMKGAFRVPEDRRDFVYGKTILIVDDVMTTGATLSECAAALKHAGAARVFALTAARD